MNVLLILTDEQRFDAVGFNGNPLVRTPNLDALAARSMIFTNHTCSTPICTPARASLFTGLYPRTHGAPHVGHTLLPATPTLANWLSDAGYRCGLFGKSHLEPELSGFAERLPQDQPYYGFHRTGLSEDNLTGPYIDWIRREHPQHEAAVWTQANESVQCKRDGKDFSRSDTTRLEEVRAASVPVELSQSHWVTRQTEQFISEQRAAGTPFFAVCSYVPPHHPQSPPEPYASLYDPAQMPVSPRLPQDYVSPWPLSHYCLYPNLPDSELQRYQAAYYGLCTLLDDCIGRLLQAVDDDTLIIFTSDHGDYNGDFGLVRKGGPWFDCLLRVPLLVHVPGRPAGRRDALTQHEDIAPTILELLGLPVPKHVQGVSFAGALTEPTACARTHSFFELGGPHEQQVTGVSDGSWKLLNYASVGDVLVNPTGGQSELKNFAGRVEAAGVQAQLQQALYRWLLRTATYRSPKHHGW